MVDINNNGEVWSNIIGTETAQSNVDGQSNTAEIISQPGHTTSAAALCNDYTNINYGTGIFTDWYLPAIDQLSELYYNKYSVNLALEKDGNALTTVFVRNYYWSSTNTASNSAWVMYFNYGYSDYDNKGNVHFVRAIRNF